VRRVSKVPHEEIEIRSEDESWLTVPVLPTLPDYFVVFAYLDDGTVLPGEPGNPIPADLTMLAAQTQNQEELFDEKSRWMVDHLNAKDNGMAVCIENLRQKISRLVVVGLKKTCAQDGQVLLEKLIDSHHYSTGLGFLKYGTPTNNTQTSQSGHSESAEDREGSYEIEILGPSSWDPLVGEFRTNNAERLERVLGIETKPEETEPEETEPETLRYLAFAGDSTDSYAAEIQRALWPVTGERFLRDLLPDTVGADAQSVAEQHFIKYVRASGPLPAIRVGDQPYGILPVTSVRGKTDANPRGWEASPLDNPESDSAVAFDEQLHSILIGLHEKWLDWAADHKRVPRVRRPDEAGDELDYDPDRDLLQILSMEPSSVSYQVRPYVDERFTGWTLMALRDVVFGSSTPFGSENLAPLHWVQRWDQVWEEWRTEQGEQWKGLIDLSSEKLETAPLLHLLAWGNVRSIDGSLAQLNDIVDASVGTPLSDPDLERLYRETLDLFSHRLDAWITSLATKRLEAMRQSKPEGIYLGVYGWVEDLSPSDGTQSAGYVHAPSPGQSAAAAILHNAYLTHMNGNGANPFRINLNSDRVRQALRIIEGVRQGQLLGAMLGYLFERGLHEHRLDEYIDNFRAAFPIVANKETELGPDEAVEAVAARNVVDGLALARALREVLGEDEDHFLNSDKVGEFMAQFSPSEADIPALNEELCLLLSSLDAVSDVLMYEGVYQSVQGNFERGGAALDAAAGNAHPPQLDSVITPVSGKSLGHRVCLLFPPPSSNSVAAAAGGTSPRSTAEPQVAAWMSDLLGDDLSHIGCSYSFESKNQAGELTTEVGTVSLEDLGISSAGTDLKLGAIDILYLSLTPPQGEETEIERRIRYWVRQTHGLAYDTPVDLNLSRPGNGQFIYGVAETLELGRQILDVLGTGAQLQPALLCHPGEADDISYSTPDVAELEGRLVSVLTHIDQVITKLGRGMAGNDPIDWDSMVEGLFEASQFGLNGAFPPEPVDPNLILADRVLLIPGYFKYEVQPGDTLWGLSRKYETTVQRLADVNLIEDPDLIQIGQVLFIPGHFEYKVKQGDTLWGISREFDTTVQKLVVLNDIENPDLIYPDQALIVPGDGGNTEFEITEATKLRDVSLRFGIPVQRLADVNQINIQRDIVLAELQKRADECRQLQGKALPAQDQPSPDQQIALLIDATRALFGRGFVVLPTFTPPSGKTYAQYQVKDGDTLQSLADEFETTAQKLIEINQLEAPYTLDPGQVLLVPDRTLLGRAFDQGSLLAGQNENRVRLWLQQAAMVHTPLRALEDTLMMTEAWRYEPALTLHVAQLPYREGGQWLGLDIERATNEEDDDEANRGALSIVAAIAGQRPGEGEVDPRLTTDRLAGLLLDQWDELIPDAEIDTSVGFQYDAPNSQAPQALLLAVPGQRGTTRKLWEVDDLAEIVKDTIDLAKIRAVDLDAMREIEDESVTEGDSSDNQGVGLIFPALLFPTDPEPDRSPSPFPATIKAWAEVLLSWEPMTVSGMIQVVGPADFTQVVLETTQQERWTLQGDFLDELRRLTSKQVEVQGQADAKSGLLQVESYKIVDVGDGQPPIAGLLSETNGAFFITEEDGTRWTLLLPQTSQLDEWVGGKIWVVGTVSGQEIDVARYGLLKLPET
jgi:LysM repeat protein